VSLWSSSLAGDGAHWPTACPACATIQWAPAAGHGIVSCGVCRSDLESGVGRTFDAALAAASGTFLLLIPANGLVFLQTAIAGTTRHSYLISGSLELWREGWPALALVLGAVLVVLPFFRFGLLALVLGCLRLGWRPPWLGRAFRIADLLQVWAMPDVGLLALWIAYTRLAATVPTDFGAGACCFIGAGLLSMVTRATLNKAAVWRAIAGQAPVDPQTPLVSCDACRLLAPADCVSAPCPRCAAPLHPRRPGSVRRAAAFTLAALLLYLPATLFPMATIPIGLEPSSYTVLEGVKDLFEARLWGLGLLVFSASFAIPLLKLLGMSWFVGSVLSRSGRWLLPKTRLYAVVEEIGRWSMVDPLVIALFIPVMQFNAKLYGRAEPAATAFCAVVVLTMIATRLFDPRRLWDAARGAAGSAA
jgi:paraquat-inducible protein A